METKIPFYHVLNMFLIGLVFIGLMTVQFFYEITEFISSLNININEMGFEALITVCIFAIVYEIGLIINRIGSVVTESFLIKSKLIPYNKDYKKYNERKAKFPIMEILSREYALSRNTLTLFLILTVIGLINLNWSAASIFFLVSVLFFFSARKHSRKIVDLMAD